ncbi:MAG TPA: OmpA family protein [Methylomirabilota bacterium]|nr:OmpA family protein [Methylomirabilota bacterium]
MAAKRIVIVLAVLTLLVAPGCAQRASQTTAPPPTAQADTSATPAPAPAPEQPATTQPAPAEPAAPAFPQNLDEFVHVPALKDVLFDPDRADIVRDGASIMMANARWIVARWLVDNRDYFVLIEGHTDTREAREDPLALSELRAKAAARFLMAMGVPETRLWTIGYGAKRPVCTDRSDACAAKNRRVHFRVKRG